MSCSGKTTLGRELAEKLNLSFLDLDDISWLPHWVQRPKHEFQAELQQFVEEQEEWVISGNYSTETRHITWQNATHIIWLDYQLRTVVWSYFKRTSHRIITKTPVCNGNYESLYNTFFAEEPLLPWILRQHKRYGVKFRRWMEHDLRDKTWIVFNSRSELKNLWQALKG